MPQPTSQTYTLKFVAPVLDGSPANWKVIRYADVLLMLAEAMNENGRTAETHAHINQVRARAGVEPYSNLGRMSFAPRSSSSGGWSWPWKATAGSTCSVGVWRTSVWKTAVCCRT